MTPLSNNKKYTENLRKLIFQEELRIKLGENGIQSTIKYFDYKNSALPLVDELS